MEVKEGFYIRKHENCCCDVFIRGKKYYIFWNANNELFV